MRFQLSEVPRVDNGQYVRASDYEALELAYVKLRHDLLEIMDNDGTNHGYKGEHIEHMLSYQGLRGSVDKRLAERLMPKVAPDDVPHAPALQRVRDVTNLSVEVTI